VKKLGEYSKEIQSVWVAHEALLRLGFSSDDVYVSCHEENKKEVLDCRLLTQDKDFIINCGIIEDEKFEDFVEEWKSFVKNYNGNEFLEEELVALFDSWPFPQSMWFFVMALTAKGFILPCAQGGCN